MTNSSSSFVTPVLHMTGVTKAFAGVPALRGASIDVRPGEVHGLVGENGAGKSTFMKILAGVYERDAGTITLGGQEVSFHHPVEAAREGHRAAAATIESGHTVRPDLADVLREDT